MQIRHYYFMRNEKSNFRGKIESMPFSILQKGNEQARETSDQALHQALRYRVSLSPKNLPTKAMVYDSLNHLFSPIGNLEMRESRRVTHLKKAGNSAAPPSEDVIRAYKALSPFTFWVE